MAFSIVPFLLLAVPLSEIAAFIFIGGQIGIPLTLGLILLTAIVGSVLLRVQGFGLLRRIAAETEAGRVPGRELIHGVMILVAGVLLLTPGFVTDTLGFLLFVPQIRDAGWRLIKNRIVVVASGMRPGGARRRTHSEPGATPRRDARGEPVIDLQETDYHREPSADTPWSRPPEERADERPDNRGRRSPGRT